MSNGNGTEAVGGAVVSREDALGNTEIATVAETASTAVAAKARAAVEARYVLALKRPRDWDVVRAGILKECKRPGFAEVARYRKPIGKGVEGFSIRFAEAAMRHMTNLFPETTTIYDDHEKRIVSVAVTDLESNVTLSKDIVIEKVVERRNLKDGQVAISKRTNSQGHTTYLVAATEDELLNKENALVSKALRGHLLRLLPGDIQDEAEELVRETLNNRAAKDPDSERKKIVDAFASLNVPPSALKEYLGHDLGTASPAELVELRKVYTTVRDSEATWHDILEAKVGKKADASATSQAEALKEKLGKKKAAGEKPTETPADATPCEDCGSKDGHRPGCPSAT